MQRKYFISNLLLISLLTFNCLADQPSQAIEDSEVIPPPPAPKEYEGKPTQFDVGDLARYGLWEKEKSVFSLRTTTKVYDRKFSGKIVVVNGELKWIKRVRAEAKDWVMQNDKKQIFFKLSSKTGLDGFDFKVEPYSGKKVKLLVLLQLDDEAANPYNIFVGKRNRHPAENIFFINTGNGKVEKAGSKDKSRITSLQKGGEMINEKL